MSRDVVPLIVGGCPSRTGSAFPVVNPATEEVIAEVASADSALSLKALGAAEQAFRAWSRATLAERRAVILEYAASLERHKGHLIELLIAETGKPYDNAEYDFDMLVTCLRFFVEEAARVRQEVILDPQGRFHNYLLRQPLGVVVGFLAWNFPLLNLGYKLGPVLASGCTAVIKPSRHTPLATLAAVELAGKAGIPAGVLNAVASDSHAATEPLLTSAVPAMVTMIGSTQAGLELMRLGSTSVKRFSLELGGNAPVLVFPDAEVTEAAEQVVNLKFANAGQVCVSPNRCFVHEAVYEEFVQRAADRARQIRLGSGRGEGTMMGPLISAEARDRVLAVVREAVEGGAKVVCGGGRPAEPARGYFIEPTILMGVSTGMRIACEEIFGPVLPVLQFTDSHDPFELANSTPYGLAAYIYTRDLATAIRAGELIQAGSVCVNEPHYAVHLPHGGLKQSGIGRDISHYGLEEYLTLKRVTIRK